MDRRRKSRALAAVSALSITALTLTACGGGNSEETPEGDVSSLRVWLPTTLGVGTVETEQKAYEEIFKTFETENDVTIDLNLIPWASYEEKYLTGVSGPDGPDLGYMYTEMMGDYIKNDALVPFDLSSEAESNMLFLDNGKVDGEQYALPFVVGGMRILYANMDILAEAGINELPTTWADFQADAAKVTESGNTAILMEWGDQGRGMLNSTFYPLLWQAGGSILTDDGTKTAFNSDAGIAAANVIKGLLDSGDMPDTVSGLSGDDVKKAFLEGRTAFWFNTDGQYPEVEESGLNVEFVPSLEGPEGRGTFVASDALVMLDHCPDKQLCTDLAEFMLAGPQMEIFHSKVATYPPIGKDETGASDNIFNPIYAENSDILNTLPVAAGSAGVYNSLMSELQQMILGQKTPEQALQDAADAGDAALASGQ